MRIYYQVPFKDREQAKCAGLWWDVARKAWYMPEQFQARHDLPAPKWKRITQPKPVGKIWNDELRKFV